MSKSKKTNTTKAISAKVHEKANKLILPADKLQEVKEPKSSKKKTMLDMLKRPEGATIAELEQATGWQNHSVRGALVNLKNKDKHPITNSKDEDGPRRYFLKDGKAATSEVAA